MSKKVKVGARLLLGVVIVFVMVGVIFSVANNAPEDKVNGLVPITTPQGPRTAEMVALVTLSLPTPAPNPAPIPIETPTKL